MHKQSTGIKEMLRTNKKESKTKHVTVVLNHSDYECLITIIEKLPEETTISAYIRRFLTQHIEKKFRTCKKK